MALSSPSLTCAVRRESTPSAVARLRLRRRPLQGLAVATATFGAAALLLATRPQPAQAQDLYGMCVSLVDDWYEDCSGNANSFQEFGCQWVAGVGYIACAVIGAVERFGPPILLKKI